MTGCNRGRFRKWSSAALAAATAGCLLGAAPAQARDRIISLNIYDGDNALAPGDVAGKVPAVNWNNVLRAGTWQERVASGFVDSDGKPLSMELRAYGRGGNGTEKMGTGSGTPNYKMMSGSGHTSIYPDVGGSDTRQASQQQLTNVGSLFAGPYDVYVYYGTGYGGDFMGGRGTAYASSGEYTYPGAPAPAAYDVPVATVLQTQRYTTMRGNRTGANLGTDPTYSDSTGFILGSGDIKGNYIVFSGLTSETLVITLSPDTVPSSPWNQNSILGIQIVGPAPNPIFNDAASGVTATQAVLNATLLAPGAAYGVWVYWNTTDGQTDPSAWAHSRFLGTYSNVAQTNLSFLATGLVSNVRYYFSFRATNQTTDAWGDPVGTFFSLGTMAVSNAPPAGIADTRADLGGALVLAGMPGAGVRIYRGDRDGGTNRAGWATWTDIGTGLGAGPFATNVTGLTPSMMHYFRCYATNPVGTEAWAAQTLSFLTAAAGGAGNVAIAATTPIASEVGLAPGAFTVFRPASATNGPLTVNYTVAGTASNGVDYARLNGSVTIPDGAATAAVPVTPRYDTDFSEGDESVSVTLAPGGYVICAPSNTATVTLQDRVILHRRVISLNIFSGVNSLAPGDAAGVVSAANWNNVPYGTGEIVYTGTIVDELGLPTPIGIRTHCSFGSNSEESYSGGPSANHTMMRGMGVRSIQFNGDHLLQIELTRIAAQFTGEYDVYVYIGVGYNGGSFQGGYGNILVSGAGTYTPVDDLPAAVQASVPYRTFFSDITGTGGLPVYNGTFTLSNGSTPGNYVVLAGLTNNTLVLTPVFTADGVGSTFDSVSVVGLQIVGPGNTPIFNGGASNVTSSTAGLTATLYGSGAAYDVWAYWNTVDGGTSPAAWTNAAFLGHFENVDETNLVCAVAGLATNTDYYFTFRATNADLDAWARPTAVFRTAGPPRIDNGGGAANVGPTFATARGTVLDAAGNVTVYWGTTDGGEDAGAWQHALELGDLDRGPLAAALEGLAMQETYWYRCYIANPYGSDWADDSRQFTTLWRGREIPVPDASWEHQDCDQGTWGNNAAPWTGGWATYKGQRGMDVHPHDGTLGSTTTRQLLTNAAYVAGRAYTLSVWTYSRTGVTNGFDLYFYRGNQSFDYANPATYLATAHHGASTAGWSLVLLNYTAAAGDAGQPIGIAFQGEFFDFVQLTTDEPAEARPVLTTVGIPISDWSFESQTPPNNIGAPWEGYGFASRQGQTDLNIPPYAGVVAAAGGRNGPPARQVLNRAIKRGLIYTLSGQTYSRGDNGGFYFRQYLFRDDQEPAMDKTTPTGWLATEPWAPSPNEWTRRTLSYQATAADEGHTIGFGLWGDYYDAITMTVGYYGILVDNISGTTGVTDTAAWACSELLWTGQAPCDLRIYYGTSDGQTDAGAWTSFVDVGAGLGAGAYSIQLTALLPDTFYYYRAYAANGAGETAWAGDTRVFLTAAPGGEGNVWVAATDPLAKEAGQDPGEFTIYRASTPSVTSGTLVVSYAVSGTAAPGVDYQPLSGVATLLPGRVSVTVPVVPIDDVTIGEPGESVAITLLPGHYLPREHASSASVWIEENETWARWRHSMKIQASGYVAGATLTNFPVAVRFRNGMGGTTFDYATFASRSGGDLRFSGPDKASNVDFEIEKWNTNGESLVWVKFPSVSGPDSHVWAFWGNPSDTNLPPCATNGAVWDGSYRFVWHYASSAGSTAYDATANRLHGAVRNAADTDWQGALLGNGLNFAREHERVAAAWREPVSEVTHEMWIRTTADGRGLISITGIEGDLNQYDRDFYISGGNLYARIYALEVINTTDAAITDGRWHHVVHVFGASIGGQKIFVDGVQRAAGVLGTSGFPNPDYVNIGWSRPVQPLGFRGVMDEVRISTCARSAAWLQACWSNQCPDSAFLTYEIPVPPRGMTLFVR